MNVGTGNTGIRVEYMVSRIIAAANLKARKVFKEFEEAGFGPHQDTKPLIHEFRQNNNQAICGLIVGGDHRSVYYEVWKHQQIVAGKFTVMTEKQIRDVIKKSLAMGRNGDMPLVKSPDREFDFSGRPALDGLLKIDMKGFEKWKADWKKKEDEANVKIVGNYEAARELAETCILSTDAGEFKDMLRKFVESCRPKGGIARKSGKKAERQRVKKELKQEQGAGKYLLTKAGKFGKGTISQEMIDLYGRISHADVRGVPSLFNITTARVDF